MCLCLWHAATFPSTAAGTPARCTQPWRWRLMSRGVCHRSWSPRKLISRTGVAWQVLPINPADKGAQEAQIEELFKEYSIDLVRVRACGCVGAVWRGVVRCGGVVGGGGAAAAPCRATPCACGRMFPEEHAPRTCGAPWAHGPEACHAMPWYDAHPVTAVCTDSVHTFSKHSARRTSASCCSMGHASACPALPCPALIPPPVCAAA